MCTPPQSLGRRVRAAVFFWVAGFLILLASVWFCVVLRLEVFVTVADQTF
jgi:hypothetical protein